MGESASRPRAGTCSCRTGRAMAARRMRTGLPATWNCGCRHVAPRAARGDRARPCSLVHSASGPMAWWMTERRPDLDQRGCRYRARPAGESAEGSARGSGRHPRVARRCKRRPPGLCGGGQAGMAERRICGRLLGQRAALSQAPHSNAIVRSIVPESARILNERFNIGGRGLEDRRSEEPARQAVS